MLFDTHCHLTLGELGEAPDAFWDNARHAGVERAVLVGIDAASSESLVDFVQCRGDLWCTVGIHPNDTENATDADFDLVASLAGADRVVGIGETGIDLYWKRSPVETQQRFLTQHAELALAHDLALILHLRDGFGPAKETLAPFAGRGLRAIVHCFTGGPDDLEPFVEWGYYISFSGILTYPKAQPLRDAAKLVPAAQLLIETDAPYLAPVPKRGERNEPAYLVHTARTLAEVRGVGFDEIAALTTANAHRAFALEAPAPDPS